MNVSIQLNKKISYLSILLMITLILLHVSITPYSYSITIVGETKIYLLALSKNNVGEAINVTIQLLFPGDGKIFIIENNGKIAYDTKISIYYALRLASLYTGISYKLYNYRIIFPPELDLEGTSATLAFTLAFMKLLRNDPVNEDIGATGIVAPNGLIGIVYGIHEKYYAGLRYGLEKIIGPPYLDLENATNYYSSIDVLNAYYEYSGKWILPSISQFQIIGPKNFSLVFIKSYNYFKKSINKIIGYIKRIPILENISKGLEEYELAEKYFAKNQYYTAASYMFRAYNDLYSLYYTALNQYKENISSILAEYAIQNISFTNEYLHRYVKSFINRPTYWNYDVLLNSIIRYLQAKLAYNIASFTNETKTKITYYVLAISRAQTALHWLELYNLSKSKLIDENLINKSLLRLQDFTNVTIKYFTSMNYIGNYTIKQYMNIMKNNTKPVQKLLDLSVLLYNITYNVLLLNVFQTYYNNKEIFELNNTLTSLSQQLIYYIGEPNPTILTSLEIINNYYKEGEELDALGFIESTSTSILSIELLIFRSLYPYTMGTGKTYEENPYEELRYLGYSKTFGIIRFTILLTSIIITSFIAGYLYAIRRISKV